MSLTHGKVNFVTLFNQKNKGCLDPFCAAITEFLRLRNLLFLTVLEFGNLILRGGI
jgi:hypothetical protein